VSEDAIAALDDAEDARWTPRERLALRYAEQVTIDAKAVDDALFDALRAEFDDGEIVELTAAISLFNMFNRFNDALQVEITRPGWVGALDAPTIDDGRSTTAKA
jgi:alkylhydroperoxidase family enzyme